MKTVLQEVLEMVNNRTENSLRTKFTEEEKKFWLEKEKKQILNANDRGYKVGRKNIAETANDYYEDTFGFLNANKTTKEELKEQIIGAILESTDLDDNSVSLTMVDMYLDDILEEFIDSYQAEL